MEFKAFEHNTALAVPSFCQVAGPSGEAGAPK